MGMGGNGNVASHSRTSLSQTYSVSVRGLMTFLISLISAAATAQDDRISWHTARSGSMRNIPPVAYDNAAITRSFELINPI